MGDCSSCSHQKLTEALRLARKRGLAIHRELGHCRGCGADKVKQEIEATGIIGAAFYSRQDAVAVAEAVQRTKQAEKAAALGRAVPEPTPVRLWLSHASAQGTEAAAILLACLAEVGLKAEWNGNPDVAICVYL